MAHKLVGAIQIGPERYGLYSGDKGVAWYGPPGEVLEILHQVHADYDVNGSRGETGYKAWDLLDRVTYCAETMGGVVIGTPKRPPPAPEVAGRVYQKAPEGPRQIPKLTKKTPEERGPVDPDSLVAALKWDVLAPADPLDQQAAQIQPAEKSLALTEVVEARVHEAFTVALDRAFQLGYLDRENRIKASNVIGDFLPELSKELLARVAGAGAQIEDQDLRTIAKAALEAIEKGGRGSGNWGHRGAPGRGGSSRGTGAASNIYGYKRAKREQALETSPAAKAVDDSLRATFASRYPDMNQEQIDTNTEMLHDALQLGPDRWDHYAPKYGIAGDLRDDYYKEIGQVDKDMAAMEQRVKDAATMQHPELNKPLFDVWMDPATDERYGELVGADHAEAEALFADTFGVNISDNTWHGVPEDVRHQNASNMYNAASDIPTVAHVLRGGQVKAIAYEDVDPGGSDTAWASWDGSKMSIKGLAFGTGGEAKDRRFPLPSGIFIHEMGHALEDHMISRGLMDIKAHYGLFGRGKHVSSYGWKTSGEDFAETFKAWTVGDPTHGYREHAPGKHAYLDVKIQQGVGQ